MCSDICEIVENVQPGRVFVVEDGGIWFSGMNANVGDLALRVGRKLTEAGYTVQPPESDGADRFGGVYLPVEEAEEVPDEIHTAVVSSPGGDGPECSLPSATEGEEVEPTPEP